MMKKIWTYTYIVTFNRSIIPKEIRTRYYLEKVHLLIPASLRDFKCENLDSTKRAAEDICHMKDVAKKT